MKEQWVKPVIVLVLITLLTIGVYTNSLHNPFQYDDFHSIVNNLNIRDLNKIPAYFTTPELFSAFGPLQNTYRPVLLTTYALNYHWNGLKPEGYRIVNLAFHLVSILMVCAIALRLFNDIRIGLIAALIFALHPFQSEVINYLSARSSVMATAFYLLAVYLFLLIRDPRWATTGLWIRGGLYLAFLVSFCLAMLTKEISLTLPAILVLADILLIPRERGRRSFLGHSWTYLPFMLVTLFFMDQIDLINFLKNLNLTPLVVQVQILVQTPWLLFIPLGLSATHEFSPTATIFDPALFISFIILLAFFLYGLYCAFSHRVVLRVLAFLILWFFITSLPTTLIPLNVAFMEHRGYLPGVGLILLVAAAIDYLWIFLQRALSRPTKYVFYALCITIILLLATGTWLRNQAWQDATRLWSDAVQKNPYSKLSHLFLGQAYQKAGELDKALEIYLKILSEDPECKALHSCTYAHLGIGEIDQDRGGLDQAIRHYEEAIRLSPQHYVLRFTANYKIGTVFQRLRQRDSAILAYREALRRNPTSHLAHYALGTVYEEQKDYDLAKEEYDTALKLAPNAHEVRLRLGVVLVYKGLLDQAAREFETVLAAEPQNGPAHRALGYIHETQDHLDQAVKHYEHAISAGSDDPGFRFHLGSLYLKIGNRELARLHWEHAVAQAPDFLEARFNLARLLQQDGRKTEAMVHYQKLKTMIPREDKAFIKQVETELRELEKDQGGRK